MLLKQWSFHATLPCDGESHIVYDLFRLYTRNSSVALTWLCLYTPFYIQWNPSIVAPLGNDPLGGGLISGVFI